MGDPPTSPPAEPEVAPKERGSCQRVLVFENGVLSLQRGSDDPLPKLPGELTEQESCTVGWPGPPVKKLRQATLTDV